MVPFFQEGMMRVDRGPKSDVQSEASCFFNNGHKHPSSAVKVIKASTGGICYTSEVEWTVSCARAVVAGAGGRGGISLRHRTDNVGFQHKLCLLYTSPSPRD